MQAGRMRKGDDGTEHIRVRKAAVQALREAIIAGGGHFHGELGKQASVAIANHAAEMLERQRKEKQLA